MDSLRFAFEQACAALGSEEFDDRAAALEALRRIADGGGLEGPSAAQIIAKHCGDHEPCQALAAEYLRFLPSPRPMAA